MIEDIDYLLENSEKDSMIIYVDSSSRNKLYYPNANEYTIQFAQPFKHVYGFEVVDGAMPNTMYNIDIYNNGIYISTVVKNQTNLTSFTTQEMFTEVSTSSTLIKMFNQADENHIVIGSETNMSIFTPTESLDKSNYAIFFKYSMVIADIIVKQKRQIETEYYFFSYNKSKYAFPRLNNDLLISIIDQNEYYLDETTMTLYYYNVTYVDQTSYNRLILSNSYKAIIHNYRRTLPVGNYDVLTIANDLGDIINTLFIDVSPTSSPPIKEGKMVFSSSHYILINAANGGLIESIGFDTYPPSNENLVTGNYKAWTIGNNYMVYGGVLDPTSSSLQYRIISPGLINMLGERFCILRIKELEDHLFGSYSYMSFTPGIGMFKMAALAGGITNLRFDYSSLVRKPFHPIGKLDRLSLKFETSKGNLYDFKGVNHQLMFIIRFLVPTSKVKFTRSILNPNYDGDIMKYLSTNRAIEYKEDSDDEEEFDDENYYQMYKKELDEFDSSTSEEGEEGDQDEDEDEESSEEDI